MVVGEAVGEGVVPGVVVLFVDAEGGLHGAAVVVGEEFGVLELGVVEGDVHFLPLAILLAHRIYE